MAKKKPKDTSHKNTLGNMHEDIFDKLKKNPHGHDEIIARQINEAIRATEHRNASRKITKTRKKEKQQHQKEHEKLIRTNTHNMIHNFNKYSAYAFDRLAALSASDNTIAFYKSLVRIQKSLVDTLTTHYIKTNGLVKLKPLTNQLKKKRQPIRKINAISHEYPTLNKSGEKIAQEGMTGALAHAIFAHILGKHPDYVVMDHDIMLDQHYHCDILAHHPDTNTYIAIDVTTTIDKPKVISDYKHHERIISYLIKRQIVSMSHYSDGAQFRHIIVNPFYKIGRPSPTYSNKDQPSYHKHFLRHAHKHVAHLINDSDVFPHK